MLYIILIISTIISINSLFFRLAPIRRNTCRILAANPSTESISPSISFEESGRNLGITDPAVLLKYVQVHTLYPIAFSTIQKRYF